MALFGPSKDERAAAENKVMQVLAGHEYLSNLLDEILIQAGKKDVEVDGELRRVSGNEWLTTCQGFYDSRTRRVVVEADAFIIKWAGSHDEQYQGGDGRVYTRPVEDVYEQIGYAYTNNGYRPLHGVNVGDVTIHQNKVIELWTRVIMERLESLFPEIKVNRNLISTDGSCSFLYEVPELQWKDWF